MFIIWTVPKLDNSFPGTVLQAAALFL